MAGRIRDEDIALVRERARIDDVVSQYVTLRNAGSGNLKGLCPFHDEKSPSFNVTPSRGMYHCLAGETEVLTWDGIRAIRDLAGGTHRVLNKHARWIDAPFRSYGVQPLMRVTMTRNRQVKEIYATDEHRWFVRTGKQRRDRREVLTKELKAGDRLCYTYAGTRVRNTTPSPFGVAHGFTFGDGTLNGTGAMALICPPKDEAMLQWFPNSTTTRSGDKNLLVHHLPKFFKSFPDLDESTPYLYGWLAGYFAADGCVAADGTVILNSAKRENLEFVRTMCARLGIGTYGITMQLRAGFEGRELTPLYRVHLINEDLTDRFFLIPKHRERFVSANKHFARRGWVVQSVEATDRVEEVFCAEVEDGHAFTLGDNILTGNCFGCGAGGDVIKFVMEMDGLGFTETVERLAEKAGVVLRYEEGGPARPSGGPQRSRLVAANNAAAEFYRAQLATPDAMTARQFLDSRGFDREAAETFGVGFSPRGGEDLLRHLRDKGFTDKESVAAGLIGEGRGLYDRFRGRLMWPIRDTSKDTVGFGARRIFDDDRIEAKYLNTPETSLYKKSHVLYGIDLARREIARSSQAVIVEGYTDVMACHLAGVPTAVATCGTAFGDDHARVIRRLLSDHDEFRGEVIFTFDGDEAGQKAALRAFQGDQIFAGQTYVAISPGGLDPCDLRLQQGEEAVRDLVAARTPLYRFVLGNVVGRYDLDRADGRVDAVREGAKLVSSIRDRSKVDAFTRELAGMAGVDTEDARREVRRASSRSARPSGPTRGRPAPVSTAPGGADEAGSGGQEGPPLPDPRDPKLLIERELLKLVLQHPAAVGRTADEVSTGDFTHPAYAALWQAVGAAGGPASATDDSRWTSAVAAQAQGHCAELVTALAVEPVRSTGEVTHAYVAQHVHRIRELTASRQIDDIRSKLQRADPGDDQEAYNTMFAELVALEQHRRRLRELAMEVE